MNVLLVCSLGASSSIMEMRIKAVAEKNGVDMTVQAISVQEVIEKSSEKFDAVLIAPQIRYMTETIRKNINQDTVLVNMGIQDYGMINAENVYKQMMEEIQKKNQ